MVLPVKLGQKVLTLSLVAGAKDGVLTVMIRLCLIYDDFFFLGGLVSVFIGRNSFICCLQPDYAMNPFCSSFWIIFRAFP